MILEIRINVKTQLWFTKVCEVRIWVRRGWYPPLLKGGDPSIWQKAAAHRQSLCPAVWIYQLEMDCLKFPKPGWTHTEENCWNVCRTKMFPCCCFVCTLLRGTFCLVRRKVTKKIEFFLKMGWYVWSLNVYPLNFSYFFCSAASCSTQNVRQLHQDAIPSPLQKPRGFLTEKLDVRRHTCDP